MKITATAINKGIFLTYCWCPNCVISFLNGFASSHMPLRFARYFSTNHWHHVSYHHHPQHPSPSTNCIFFFLVYLSTNNNNDKSITNCLQEKRSFYSHFKNVTIQLMFVLCVFFFPLFSSSFITLFPILCHSIFSFSISIRFDLCLPQREERKGLGSWMKGKMLQFRFRIKIQKYVHIDGFLIQCKCRKWHKLNCSNTNLEREMFYICLNRKSVYAKNKKD